MVALAEIRKPKFKMIIVRILHRSMTIKTSIGLCLSLYCITILVITHIKTEGPTFAKILNNGCSMRTITNLFLVILAALMILLRIYMR